MKMSKWTSIATAVEWREASHENEAAYAWFLAKAKSNAEMGHFFGMKQLAEEYRWMVATGARQGRFKLNNSLVTPIGRLIIHDAPEVAPWLNQRKAKCDTEEIETSAQAL